MIRRYTSMVLLSLMLVTLVGCGDEQSKKPSKKPAATAPASPAADDELSDEDQELNRVEEELKKGRDEEGEDPNSRAALERRCFEGDQAACDRLGH